MKGVKAKIRNGLTARNQVVGNGESPTDAAVGVAVGPERDGVALLLVGRPEERHRQRQQDERAHRAPFVAAERLRLAGGLAPGERVGRQHRRGIEVDRKPDRHADAGRGEAVVPAELFAERAADQRRQERAEVDADVEDREGAVAARVAGRVERADLGRDVRLEGAVAEDEPQEREQEQRLERHHEMADRHQRSADHHHAALAEHAVGEIAAEDRREIHEPGVEAVDLRRQRLDVERAEDRFHAALSARRSRSRSARARVEQILHHVEHEQRAHAVVGEALPHLGGEQDTTARADGRTGSRRLRLPPPCGERTIGCALTRTGFPGRPLPLPGLAAARRLPGGGRWPAGRRGADIAHALRGGADAAVGELDVEAHAGLHRRGGAQRMPAAVAHQRKAARQHAAIGERRQQLCERSVRAARGRSASMARSARDRPAR